MVMQYEPFGNEVGMVNGLEVEEATNTLPTVLYNLNSTLEVHAIEPQT